MKRKVLFILCSIFITVSFASAQSAKRTVTNTDLEKFKQKRLNAERDLRENYEKLGFPSPEELEKQRKADESNAPKTLRKTSPRKIAARTISNRTIILAIAK